MALAMRATDELYDVPVSNHGARCRFIVKLKQLESVVRVVSPSEIGGLKSDTYRELHPQGKMPLLVTKDEVPIPESDLIARYLLETYPSGPSLLPEHFPSRVLSDTIVRFHDLYISPIQGAMYKAAPPFAAFGRRYEALNELKAQFTHIEKLVDRHRAAYKVPGDYLTGPELSLADVSLFPTAVFALWMLPKQFGWTPNDLLGPRLLSWWECLGKVPAAQKIKSEIENELEGWNGKGRWKNILYAGYKDTAPSTIFDKIINKEIPAETLYEDDQVLAFKDIAPSAPFHALVIPKRRDGLTQLRYATAEHDAILGQLLRVAGIIAREQGLEGYRFVINDGEKGSQSVFHLHVHVLGGKQFSWPPG